LPAPQRLTAAAFSFAAEEPVDADAGHVIVDLGLHELVQHPEPDTHV
jgi:hypothetical protein